MKFESRKVKIIANSTSKNLLKYNQCKNYQTKIVK